MSLRFVVLPPVVGQPLPVTGETGFAEHVAMFLDDRADRAHADLAAADLELESRGLGADDDEVGGGIELVFRLGRLLGIVALVQRVLDALGPLRREP